MTNKRAVISRAAHSDLTTRTTQELTYARTAIDVAHQAAPGNT
jgi:hypothetical protein